MTGARKPASVAWLLMLFIAGVCFAEPSATDETAARHGEFIERLTGEFRLEPTDSEKQPLERTEKSILQWSWERNGFTDGQTYVWGTKGRPQAIGGAFLVPAEKAAYYEFVSISAKPLSCRLRKDTVWTPPAVELAWWKFPSAAAPAASERGRLTQMRTLAQQISGVARMGPPRYEEGTRWELRLLTTPLHRYADTEREVLDGAVFVMVMGTDPQLLMLLEAQQDEGKPAWKAAFAPLSGFELAALHGEKEIWNTPKAADGHAKDSVWHLSHPVDAAELFAAPAP